MKGIALNRAIYIFTIVTIVYTPLGFVAVRTYLRFTRLRSAVLTENICSHFGRCQF